MDLVHQTAQPQPTAGVETVQSQYIILLRPPTAMGLALGTGSGVSADQRDARGVHLAVVIYRKKE